MGGLVNIALIAIVGRAYVGLSLPLVDHTLAGHAPAGGAFALKLLFTALALGFGLPGRRGHPAVRHRRHPRRRAGRTLHLGVRMLGSIGFVAVFAGAANVPLACTVMGMELFGMRAGVLVVALGWVAAYLCSGHHGLYVHHRPVGPGPRSPGPAGGLRWSWPWGR